MSAKSFPSLILLGSLLASCQTSTETWGQVYPSVPNGLPSELGFYAPVRLPRVPTPGVQRASYTERVSATQVGSVSAGGLGENPPMNRQELVHFDAYRTPSGTSTRSSLGGLPPNPPRWPSVPTNGTLTQLKPAENLPLVRPAVPLMPARMHQPLMTLEQLEQSALASNPSLAEARARVQAARGKWVQVGLPPNTVAGYSGQQLGSGGEAEQHGLFLQQEFVRGSKLELNREVVAQEVAAAEQRFAEQRQRVLTDVRLGYYDILIAQRRNDTTAQLVQIAQQAVDTSKALYPQEVSRLDLMRTRNELQLAELLKKNTANRHTAAWSRLTAVMGIPGMPLQQLSGSVDTLAEEMDPNEVLVRMDQESPEMAGALRNVERARWAVRRAVAEPVPNVTVQTIVQSDNGTNSSNANLQVTIPVPWRDRNQGAIRQAQAEAVAAERAVDRLRLSFQQRLADVYQRYANARNQVHYYSKPDGILATSQDTLDFVRKVYEAGEVTSLDLISAQQNYSKTNLSYIEALGEFWAAVVEIDGLLLKDSLDRHSRP